MKRNIIAILSLFLLCGCSDIREDRSICPCWLNIDFSKTHPDIKSLHLWIFDDTGILQKRDTLYPSEYTLPYEVEVTRGSTSYYIWGNIGEGTELQDNLTYTSSVIKKDDVSADSLFYYKNSLNTLMETACDTVRLQKEFATVNITLKGNISDGDTLTLEMMCNTAGQYIDSKMIDSPATIRALPYSKDGDTNFSFRIMRQRSLEDLNITLTVTHTDKPTITTQYPLGEWLKKEGYDMFLPNLSDVFLVLDISHNLKDITIKDYNVVPPSDIEI